jgi:hypothetical protein
MDGDLRVYKLEKSDILFVFYFPKIRNKKESHATNNIIAKNKFLTPYDLLF